MAIECPSCGETKEVGRCVLIRASHATVISSPELAARVRSIAANLTQR